MKYLLALTLSLIALTSTAQETSRTYEASLEHVSIAYNYTPDTILYASFLVGHKSNTYASSRITARPFVIKSKFIDAEIEPLAFFEYGFDGSTFTNYGVGVAYKINKSIETSVKYSQWGVSASITIF